VVVTNELIGPEGAGWQSEYGIAGGAWIWIAVVQWDGSSTNGTEHGSGVIH